MAWKKELLIMNKSWIFYVCKRFSRVDRTGRAAATSVLATLGICLGVTTLIVIMSVMNGFQMSFIDTILEVSSYHLQVSDLPESKEKDFFDFCKNDSYLNSKVKSVSEFYEAQTLMVSESGAECAALIRAISPDYYYEDSEFQNELVMTRGSFNISTDDYIVLGSSLARSLDVEVGDEVNLFVLSGGNDVSLFSNDRKFYVSGIFASGYSEINSSYCFVNIDVAKKYFGEKNQKRIGIKLFNSEDDLKVLSRIKNNFSYPEINVKTWQDYNKSFYSTLKIEKNMLSKKTFNVCAGKVRSKLIIATAIAVNDFFVC